MKKLNLVIVLLMSFVILSCSQDEQAIDEVFDTVTRGAVLRTTASTSAEFDLFNLESSFSITIEEQDAEGGDLLQEVNAYIGFQDNSEENGTTSPNEALVTTIPASAFGVSVFGLPEADLSITLGESIGLLGITTDDFTGGDFFILRLELVLTDGRTFTSNQASGTISQSFYSSPFQYPISVVCLFDEPDYFVGTYEIDQLTGSDPFFSSEVFGTQIVEVTANGINREMDIVYFPGIFDSDYKMNLALVCGKILVTGTINSGSLGCGSNIGFTTGNVTSTFDTNFVDDDVFEISITDFDPDGSCETGGYQVTIRMTKQ